MNFSSNPIIQKIVSLSNSDTFHQIGYFIKTRDFKKIEELRDESSKNLKILLKLGVKCGYITQEIEDCDMTIQDLIHQGLKNWELEGVVETARSYFESAEQLYGQKFEIKENSIWFHMAKTFIDYKSAVDKSSKEKNITKIREVIMRNYDFFSILMKRKNESLRENEFLLKYMLTPQKAFEIVKERLILGNFIYEIGFNWVFEIMDYPFLYEFITTGAIELYLLSEFQKGLDLYKPSIFEKNFEQQTEIKYRNAFDFFKKLSEYQFCLFGSLDYSNLFYGKCLLYCSNCCLKLKEEKKAEHFFIAAYNRIIFSLRRQQISYDLKKMSDILENTMFFYEKIATLYFNEIKEKIGKMISQCKKMIECIRENEHDINNLIRVVMKEFKKKIPLSFSFRKIISHYLEINGLKAMKIMDDEIKIKKKLYGKRNFDEIYPVLEIFEEEWTTSIRKNIQDLRDKKI